MMNTNRYSMILGLGVLVALAGCEAENNDASDSYRDNDRIESDDRRDVDGDRSAYDKTTIDQSETVSAIAVTAEIRRAIMQNDTMSISAQNSKIITDESGLVTLRGVVNSQQEKNAIEVIAKNVAGVNRVDNLLDVDTQ